MNTGISFINDLDHRPGVVVSEERATPNAVRTVVELKGELDAAALNSLVGSFDAAITRDASDVVVDLAGVEFIGAGWIGTLVRSYARLEAQDRGLSLRSPSHVVCRLLELCGLAYLIEPVLIEPRGHGMLRSATCNAAPS